MQRATKFEGRSLDCPTEDQYSHAKVFARMSDADAEAAALEFGAHVVASEIAHFNRCLTNACGRWLYSRD